MDPFFVETRVVVLLTVGVSRFLVVITKRERKEGREEE